MAATAAVRWSCARCDVSVGRIDGGPADLPETWTQVGDESYCLICSRAMVGEAAMESAPDASSREELMRVRRDAVIEFEIDRTPLAPNRVIAHACRTSLMTVATVRRTLDGDASAKPSRVPSGT
jgi:hypothetical protein